MEEGEFNLQCLLILCDGSVMAEKRGRRNPYFLAGVRVVFVFHSSSSLLSAYLKSNIWNTRLIFPWKTPKFYMKEYGFISWVPWFWPYCAKRASAPPILWIHFKPVLRPLPCAVLKSLLSSRTLFKEVLLSEKLAWGGISVFQPKQTLTQGTGNMDIEKSPGHVWITQVDS